MSLVPLQRTRRGTATKTTGPNYMRQLGALYFPRGLLGGKFPDGREYVHTRVVSKVLPGARNDNHDIKRRFAFRFLNLHISCVPPPTDRSGTLFRKPKGTTGQCIWLGEFHKT